MDKSGTDRTKHLEKITMGRGIRTAAGTALKVAAGVSLVIVAVMTIALAQGTKVEDFRIGGEDE